MFGPPHNVPGAMKQTLPMDEDQRRHVTGRLLVVLLLALAVVAVAIVAVALTTTNETGPPWVAVGAVDDVRSRGVTYLEHERVFVVASEESFVALSAEAPHIDDERVLYCPSSGWFVGQHGEMFDARGNYVLGPASAGLTRVPVRVTDGTVEVDPSTSLGAPPRGSQKPERRTGPFCDNDGRTPPVETEPGFTSIDVSD